MDQRTAAEPYLRIRGVTKQFGPFTALDDVDLDILPGEFVSFLGPSGCGKTTLLRAISGLDVQTSGTIQQGGRDISTLPVASATSGSCSSPTRCSPTSPIRTMSATAWSRPASARAEIEPAGARAPGSWSGLPEQADKYPAQLSGGQQQRVALARALALSPGPAAPRRAALGAGCARPRPAARRDPRPAASAQGDHDHGHARPGGGAHHVRPDRGDEQGPDRAGRHARRDLQPSRRPPSSPTSSAR